MLWIRILMGRLGLEEGCGGRRGGGGGDEV